MADQPPAASGKSRTAALNGLLQGMFEAGLIERPVEVNDLAVVDAGQQLAWAPTTAQCRSCGGTRWWRLERLSTGEPGDWVCATCHPPEPDAQIDLKSEGLPPGQPSAQPHRSTARPPAFWDGYLESGSGTGGGW